MNPTLGVLALEEILTDPRYRPFLEAVAAAQPAHLRDQSNAASRHTDQSVRMLAALALDGARETWQQLSDSPPWLRLEVLTRINALVARTADTCRHDPNPGSPQPVFAAACKPNLVVCTACVHLLSMPKGSKADATCDSCGHICAGPKVDDGIYPGLARLGLLVFMYGTCGNCHPHPETL
jgi:hypothetical protein